ncbi:MFS transporter (plasmid) [Ralstonia pickettii]|uniref:MFS transporter n=1 Tax=Ralstonia TaxID=48736 RepID=UPI00271526C0|nr:MFS transporter [Ralstonia pickettii]WKZ88719.1 MFS transporter [Ralstonia pickettii]
MQSSNLPFVDASPTPVPLSQQEPHDLLKTWSLALAQLVSWGTVYYSFSLFVVPMEHAMGWSRASLNAALSLGLLVSGFAALPVGRWIDAGYGRRVMVVGSALSGAMLLLWAYVNWLPILFVVWFGLGLSMSATLYDPVFAVITHRYPLTYRAKITLITLVAGFASTVFIPLTGWLVNVWGWRATLIVLAVANLTVCLPIHAAAMPSSRGAGARKSAEVDHKSTDAVSIARALRSITFWALLICFTAYYAVFAGMTFHLVPLLKERGVPTAVMLTVMAMVGPAQVVARAAWYVFGRALPMTTLGIIVVLALPLSVLLLMAVSTSAWGLMGFALLYGAANGMMTILRGTAIQELLWTQGYGALSGMLSMPSNLAKGLAPIAVAGVWSITMTYGPAEYVFLLLALVATAAFAIAARYSGREVQLPSLHPTRDDAAPHA